MLYGGRYIYSAAAAAKRRRTPPERGSPCRKITEYRWSACWKRTARAVPGCFLHSCCGPCSSAVLEALCPHFEVTVDYYNPNIDTAEEYARRAAEQARFAAAAPFAAGTQVLVAPYEPQAFYAAVKGLEHIPEGGARCFACYALRLRHAAALAKQLSCEYFCTTLSVSPHKKRRKAERAGLRHCRRIWCEVAALRFQKGGRLPPFHGAERGIRHVQAGLLRLRVLQTRGRSTPRRAGSGTVKTVWTCPQGPSMLCLVRPLLCLPRTKHAQKPRALCGSMRRFIYKIRAAWKSGG